MLHANPGLLLHMQSFSLELNTTRRARGSPSEDIIGSPPEQVLTEPYCTALDHLSQVRLRSWYSGRAPRRTWCFNIT